MPILVYIFIGIFIYIALLTSSHREDRYMAGYILGFGINIILSTIFYFFLYIAIIYLFIKFVLL